MCYNVSMKIFVVNCGSSSIKYQLINMADESVMAKGLVDRIGMDGSHLTHTPGKGEKVDLKEEIPNHKVGIELVVKALLHPEYGVIKDMSEIGAVGHRIVHGGELFSESVLIDDKVMQGIEACVDMAPLHNPANIIGIKACQELMPKVPQVAVFDTAFHQTMPKESFLYGIPYEYYEKYGIRRYGFHGTSHRFVASEAARLLGKPLESLKLITCHLGNGASVCAVKYGKSVDTSMGYTPLDGLLMGTRAGAIDPAVVSLIMKKENLSCEAMDTLLNKKSGALGVSGLSSDFRDLEDGAAAGNERCQLVIDMFNLRVRKFIGAYAAEMGGVDAIIFTGGLGENGCAMRGNICEGLECLGAKVDPAKNTKRGKTMEFSADDSKVKIWCICTNEELVIARDTDRLCKKLG